MINIGSIFEDTIYKETYKKDVVDSTDDELWARDTVLTPIDTAMSEDEQLERKKERKKGCCGVHIQLKPYIRV